MKPILFSLIILAAAVGAGSLSHTDDSGQKINRRANAYSGRMVISCSPLMSYVPTDFLMTPIDVKENIGTINFSITTAEADAQVFFNQGMAFLYSFEYVQAARSFYTALAKDSNAAMVYWGLSQAYGRLDDSTVSREMAASAMSKMQATKPEEQMMIRIQSQSVQPAHDSLAIGFMRVALQSLADSANKNFPANAEMWAFTGILRAFGDIGPGDESYRQSSRHAIDDYLLKALEVNPTHFGVWHYLIHFNEANSDFNKALSYGQLYTKAAPQVAHAWHMYAHDLMKTGRVTEAIEKFNHAFDLEQQKYISEKMPARYDWHHSHNMELLAYCYQYQGKYKDAERVFSVLDTLTAITVADESLIRKGHCYFYLNNGQPARAKALAMPLINSPEDENHFTGHFIAGLADLFSSDEESAMNHYNQMIHLADSMRDESIVKGRPGDLASEDFGYLYAKAGIVQMGAGLMRNPGDTLMIAKMNSIQKTLLKQTGPDPWIDALYFLQLLTELSIKAGNLDLAEHSARNMMLHDPGYPGAFMMMARIKNKQGDRKQAQSWLAKAKTGYKQADPEFRKAIKL